MSELTFTQREIDALTAHLGSLAAQLGESQSLLLKAIFAAGVDTVERVPEPVQRGPEGAPGPPTESLTPDARELRDQLRQSFVPGGPPPPRPLVIRVTPH